MSFTPSCSSFSNNVVATTLMIGRVASLRCVLSSHWAADGPSLARPAVFLLAPPTRAWVAAILRSCKTVNRQPRLQPGGFHAQLGSKARSPRPVACRAFATASRLLIVKECPQRGRSKKGEHQRQAARGETPSIAACGHAPRLRTAEIGGGKKKPRGGNGASHGSLEGTIFDGWGKDPSDKPSYALAAFADQLQKSNLRARFAAQFAAQLPSLGLLVSHPAARGNTGGTGGVLL
jgi:hypothetical protein